MQEEFMVINQKIRKKKKVITHIPIVFGAIDHFSSKQVSIPKIIGFIHLIMNHYFQVNLKTKLE